jgi:hypothetical protein
MTNDTREQERDLITQAEDGLRYAATFPANSVPEMAVRGAHIASAAIALATELRIRRTEES